MDLDLKKVPLFPKSTIPMLLHQIWFDFEHPGQDQDPPSRLDEIQKTWRRQTHNMTCWTWKESNAREIVERHYPWFLNTYDSYKHSIYRVDAFRIMALHRYGGVYADMDCVCKRNLCTLMESQKTLALVDCHRVFERLTNWFIFAAPLQPFFLHVLRCMQRRQRNVLLHRRITGAGPLYCTGPWLLQHAYATYHGADKSRVGILDLRRAGQPDPPDDSSSARHVDDYVTHNSEGSWFSWGGVGGDVLLGLLFLFLLFICCLSLALCMVTLIRQHDKKPRKTSSNRNEKISSFCLNEKITM
jgi:hypothetical protein